MWDEAYVYLMEDEEGHRYILVEDHPTPPSNAIQSFGSFPLPEAGGWGEAGEVAKQKATELNLPIEYYSDRMESWLAQMKEW
ncbi:MAG: hypothetical protein AB1631_19815 [Acidobacteriota bacterium]